MIPVEQKRELKLPDPDYPEPGGIMAAGLLVVAKKFPVPNVEGLSPEEAEIALNRWRAEVHEFYERQKTRGRELARPM